MTLCSGMSGSLATERIERPDAIGIELVGLRSRILQRRGKRAAHLRLPGA
jgi:hypothetical protein